MLDNVGKVRHLSAVNVFTACYLQLLWVRSAAICKKGRGNRQNCHMIDGFYEAKSHASPSRNPYMLHKKKNKKNSLQHEELHSANGNVEK